MDDRLKEFLLFEDAMALKELGFNESCLGSYMGYNITDSNLVLNGYESSRNWEIICKVPTYRQAFRWFRNKYNVDMLVMFDNDRGTKNFPVYYYGIYDLYDISSVDDSTEGEEYITWEDAELACLRALIKKDW